MSVSNVNMSTHPSLSVSQGSDNAQLSNTQFMKLLGLAVTLLHNGQQNVKLENLLEKKTSANATVGNSLC